MPPSPSQDTIRIARDLHYVTQGLRVMLWNFTFLTPIFTRLKAAHDLKNVVKDMIPPLLAFFAEVMGQEWSAPRMAAGTREIFERLERECRDAGVSAVISQWIMGEGPMALEFLEFMTQRNIVGIFQKGEITTCWYSAMLKVP